MKALAIYLRQNLVVNATFNWCLIFTNSCISMQDHNYFSPPLPPFFLFIFFRFLLNANSLFAQDVNYYYNESSQKDRSLEMISPLSSRRLFGSCCFENLLPPTQATLQRESCLNILAIREGPNINYGYENSKDTLTNRILWNPFFSHHMVSTECHFVSSG